MPPVKITAQGTSTIFRQAERAVIHVRVSSDGTSQENVSKEVTSTANELREMLKRLAPKTEKGT
jgi:lambda repressor-like predicted transcriptional regulator